MNADERGILNMASLLFAAQPPAYARGFHEKAALCQVLF